MDTIFVLDLTSESSETTSLPTEPQQSHSKWVPPQKDIVQFFAEKPYVVANADEAYYEFDEEDKVNSYSDEGEEDNTLRCDVP